MSLERRFFFDMDGVLAKWESASLEQMTTPGFFLNRVPDDNSLKMLNVLKIRCETEGAQIYILSSYLLPMSMEEKIQWNEKYTGIPLNHQVYVKYGESKSDAIDQIGGVRKNDVLLDDFSDNLREWKGIAVKYYNGINGTKGTWDGFSIHANMNPDIMASQLEAISIFESIRIRTEEKGMDKNVVMECSFQEAEKPSVRPAVRGR